MKMFKKLITWFKPNPDSRIIFSYGRSPKEILQQRADSLDQAAKEATYQAAINKLSMEENLERAKVSSDMAKQFRAVVASMLED